MGVLFDLSQAIFVGGVPDIRGGQANLYADLTHLKARTQAKPAIKSRAIKAKASLLFFFLLIKKATAQPRYELSLFYSLVMPALDEC